MELNICPGCGALVERLVEICPTCGCVHPGLTHLEPDEIVYTCGQCQRPRYLRREDNPSVTHNQFAVINKGISLHLPLTTWNTVFRCRGCQGWNWVTLDERICGFKMPCPECGAITQLTTLGRQLGLAKGFWHPLVLGEWRQAGRHLTLKCGHQLYLPTVIAEPGRRPAPSGQPAPPASSPANRRPVPITAAPAPAAAGQPPAPQSEKKKTQPIPLAPPHR